MDGGAWPREVALLRTTRDRSGVHVRPTSLAREEERKGRRMAWQGRASGGHDCLIRSWRTGFMGRAVRRCVSLGAVGAPVHMNRDRARRQRLPEVIRPSLFLYRGERGHGRGRGRWRGRRRIGVRLILYGTTVERTRRSSVRRPRCRAAGGGGGGIDDQSEARSAPLDC